MPRRDPWDRGDMHGPDGRCDAGDGGGPDRRGECWTPSRASGRHRRCSLAPLGWSLGASLVPDLRVPNPSPHPSPDPIALCQTAGCERVKGGVGSSHLSWTAGLAFRDPPGVTGRRPSRLKEAAPTRRGALEGRRGELRRRGRLVAIGGLCLAVAAAVDWAYLFRTRQNTHGSFLDTLTQPRAASHHLGHDVSPGAAPLPVAGLSPRGGS